MSNPTVADVLSRPYTRYFQVDGPNGIAAGVLEFPGCFSSGATPPEAWANLDEAITLWVEGTLEDGNPIPDPITEREYSGRLQLRLPPPLHEQAVLRAAIEDTSLNRLLTNALAAYLGRSLHTDAPASPNLIAALRAIVNVQDADDVLKALAEK